MAIPIVTDVTDPALLEVGEDETGELNASLLEAAYRDTDRDPIVTMKFTELPQKGEFTISGTPVVLEQDYTVAQMDSAVFTPTANANGADSFRWNASDGVDYAAADALASFEITPYFDFPTAGSFDIIVGDATPYNFDQSPFLVENDSTNPDSITRNDGNGALYIRDFWEVTSLSLVSLPSKGVLTLDDGINPPTPVGSLDSIPVRQIPNLVYTPNPGESGTDDFDWTVTTFVGSRGVPRLVSNVATTFLELFDETIIPANEDIDDVTDINTLLNFTTQTFIDNFTDNSGSPLASITIDALPSNGVIFITPDVSIAVGQSIPAADLDRLVYVPSTDFTGVDTFEYTANNGFNDSAASSVITITIGTADTTPDAPITNDTVTTEENMDSLIRTGGAAKSNLNLGVMLSTITLIAIAALKTILRKK